MGQTEIFSGGQMDAGGQSAFASDESSNDTYYTTDDELEDELCNMETEVLILKEVITPLFFSVVVVFSLIGNILVMVILAKYENLRSLTNTLILNLAMSDMIFTVGLPFWAYYHMYNWMLGEIACKIVSFIFYVGFYSSGILLIMMTVHRYVSVVRPLSDLVTSRGFVGVIASVLIWTLGSLAALPALMFVKVVDENECEYEINWKDFGIYQQNVMFLVTLLVFCFCYPQILCRLVRSPAQRKRHRTLKLICTLVIVYILGWAPYNVLIFLWPGEHHTMDCETQKTWVFAFYIGRLFAYSHCCLNPVFYVFVGVKYKNHLKRMLRGWGKQRNRNHSIHSRLTITSQTSGEEFSR